MTLEIVRLLSLQRQLHEIPRGYGRFREYLRVMLTEDGQGVALPPLLVMNPMGREHMTELLQTLIALDAEDVVEEAALRALAEVGGLPAHYRLAVVVADDLKGGWTNRFDYEFKQRFGDPKRFSDPRDVDRPPDDVGWMSCIVWGSEPPTAQGLREVARAAVFRAAYSHSHGPAHTLRDMLAQEGTVLAQSGCTQPALDAEDIAYTREVLAPALEARGFRTGVEYLFGDQAARSLGFTPRGLSDWAGIALALHDARQTLTASKEASLP